MAREFVFIDAGIAHLDTLLATIGTGYSIVLLDANTPALQQMANALQGSSDIAAIHVISHGASGFLEMSSGTLAADTLETPENQAALAAIKASLAADGDILLYGCEVGYGEAGASFVASLAEFTGADVAASTDLTGSTVLGGDSTLEVSVGIVDALALDLSAYTEVLASGVFYSTTGSRVGVSSGAGTTITYDPINVTVTDTSTQLIIHALDVDYVYGNYSSEHDAVYLTGPNFSETFIGYLVGTNGNWSYTSFDVSSLVTQTGNYTVTIRPSVTVSGWVMTTDFAELFVGTGGFYITTLASNGQDVSSYWNAGANGTYTIEYILIDGNGTAVAQKNSSVTEGDTANSATDTSTLNPNSSAGYNSWGDIPDGTYTLQAKLFDSSGIVQDSVSIPVTISSDNIPPNITGPSGSAGDATSAKSVYENQTAVATFTADETVTWSTVSGKDAAKFSLSSGGVLTFSSAPTFEVPTDTDTNNTYLVDIQARDAAGNTSIQTVTVTVMNVIETGSIDITTATDSGANDALTNNGLPVITFTGEPNLTVTLKGPDGTTLAAGQYSVAFTAGATNESGTYTVTLIDGTADTGGASDPFGTYQTPNGPATGNGTATRDGTYTLVAADNYSNSKTVGSFVIDTTPPVTSAFDMTDATDSGRSQSDEATNNGLPVLTFTGEDGLTITLKGVDGTVLNASQYSVAKSSPDAGGNVTYTVTLVDANTGTGGAQQYGTNNAATQVALGNPAATRDGTYTVVGTDAAANSATIGTFEIDTVRPVVTGYDMANTRETGISLDDELTSNGKPMLTFMSEAGLDVYLDGPDGTRLVLNQHYKVAYNNGLYTVTLIDATLTNGATQDGFGTYANGVATGNSAATRDGTYTISVADTAGNGASVGTFEIDTSAPGIQVVSGSIDISSDTGASNTDFNTSTAAQTITATLTRGLLTGERLLGSLDAGRTWTDISASALGTAVSWGATFVTSGQIRLKVQDAAGNDSVLRSQSYVLDQSRSSNSVRNIDISTDTGTSATDFITSVAAQTVTAQLAGALAAGETVYGSIDGGATWTNVNTYISGRSITWTGNTLQSGASNIRFFIEDAAGNRTTEAVQAYTVVAATANVSVSGIDISADTGTSASDFLTNTARQTITATLTGSLNAAQKLYGSVDGGVTWTDVTAQISGSTVSWANATLKAGTGYSIKFKVMDSAGNVASTATQAYTLDTSRPSVTATFTAISNDDGLKPGDFITTTASQDVSARLSGTLNGDRLMASTNNGATWTDITSSVSGTTVNWQGLTLASGANTLMLRVADSAGNAGTTTSKVVTVQNVARVVALDAVKLETHSGNNPYTFEVLLDAPALQDTTLNWSVRGYGTDGATGADFGDGTSRTLPTGTITIAAGETRGVLSIPIYTDTVFAQDQGFSVTLAKQAGDNGVIVGTSVAYGLIQNDDALSGTTGADRLLGSQSAEAIYGLAGNDRIQGRDGDDTLVGAAGRDTFVFEASGTANGRDTLDFVTGAAGDVFNFSAFLSPGSLDRHAGSGTAIVPYSTSNTGDVAIANKLVLLDGGVTRLTVADIAAEIHGSENAFSLSSGGKAVIISGNAASAGTMADIFYVNDALDGVLGTVSAADVAWVGSTASGIDLDTLTTANFISL